MDIPCLAPPAVSDSRQVWEALKRVIAHSSGFQRWLSEKQRQSGVTVEQPLDLDACVTAYLRQALESLAY